jgi:hypothetical protein
MQMTQADYNDRKRRVDAGTGDDEDARLVKQYEEAGYTAEGKAPNQPEPATAAVPIRADGDVTRNEQDGSDNTSDNADTKPGARKSTSPKQSGGNR